MGVPPETLIPPSNYLPSSSSGAGRPFLPILGNRRLRLATWGFFLLLSGIMVFHNLVIRSWGIGTFPSFSRTLQQAGEEGVFGSSPLVDAGGKPSILRYARTPVGRLLHILPAGLWSVIAPLQLSPTFRSEHRTAHRRMGQLFIVMSVSIAIGVVPILTSGATIMYQVFSKVMMLVLTACFLGAGLLSFYHARNKRIAQHRVWMLRHVAMGYSVHLLRVLGPLCFGFFPALIPGYTDHTPEGVRLRSLAFGSCFLVSVLLSVGSMELWLHHTSSLKAQPQPLEGKKKAT